MLLQFSTPVLQEIFHCTHGQVVRKILRQKVVTTLLSKNLLNINMNEEIGNCGGGSRGDGGGCGGGSWPSSSSSRRSSGVRGPRLPSFLTKTYNIVNDPNTNSIISWGKYGNSFIIWDHIQFSAQILPTYFKHNNLSSFVYQLNNYGFRKIGVDHQWEYENPHFQAGKLHLLTNIKRRGQKPDNGTRRRHWKRALCDSIGPEIVRNDMNESKLEIEKLIKQQKDMEFHIMALEEEVKKVESTSKKLTMYYTKACKIIAQKMRGKTGKENNDDDEVRKKIKLDKPECPPEKNETKPGLDFWKKILLEDDEACEGEVGIEMANEQAKIVLDLEDLIVKLEDRDDE